MKMCYIYLKVEKSGLEGEEYMVLPLGFSSIFNTFDVDYIDNECTEDNANYPGENIIKKQNSYVMKGPFPLSFFVAKRDIITGSLLL